MTNRCVVIYYAWSACAFRAGIECWHCSYYDAWLLSVSSQVQVSAESYNRLLYKIAAFRRDINGTSTTERPFGTNREEKRISSFLQVSISSRYDLSY